MNSFKNLIRRANGGDSQAQLNCYGEGDLLFGYFAHYRYYF